MGKLTLYIVQQPPVARSPTVYTLLYIAYDEVGVVFMAHALLQQHPKIFPLDSAGVLELVYHNVVQVSTYLLEYKGRVAVLYNGVKQVLSVA